MPRGPALLLDNDVGGAQGLPHRIRAAGVDAYIDMSDGPERCPTDTSCRARNRRVLAALSPSAGWRPATPARIAKGFIRRDCATRREAAPNLRARLKHPGDTTARRLAARHPLQPTHPDDGPQPPSPLERRRRVLWFWPSRAGGPRVRAGRPTLWSRVVRVGDASLTEVMESRRLFAITDLKALARAARAADRRLGDS